MTTHTIAQIDNRTQEEAQRQNDAQGRRLINIAEDATFFRTPGGEAYIEIPIRNHHQVYTVRHRAVRDWLLLEYHHRYGSTPNQNTLNSALQLLESRARFSESVHEVYIRIAGYNGNVYLDLCNDAWQVVEIDAEGWRVINNSPVKFRRANGMLPLPTPEHGGNINELQSFLNHGSDENFVLLVGALVGMFNPDGPYPILNMNGEQGCAKTSNARFIRGLIDPNQAMIQRQPRDSENMHGTAHSSWVLSYDNISRMQQWLSDMLCGMATGSGDGRRQLYSDSEQVVFSAKRPCIINGIEEIAVYGDLMDRCVTVVLPVISETSRVAERDLNAGYEAARPRILGALLDAVSCGIRDGYSVRLPTLPRMADFALWVTACESALGWQERTFYNVYTSNRSEATRSQVEASPVANAVLKFLEESGDRTWSGTFTELYEKLRDVRYVPESVLHTTWPRNATHLSNDLRRVMPSLRKLGVELSEKRTAKRKVVVLTMGDAHNDGSDASVTLQYPRPRPVPPPVEAVDMRDDSNDANDGRIHSFTTSNLNQKIGEDIVKGRKLPSLASHPSQPAPQARRGDDGKNIVASEASSLASLENETYEQRLARLNRTPNEYAECEHGLPRCFCPDCTPDDGEVTSSRPMKPFDFFADEEGMN